MTSLAAINRYSRWVATLPCAHCGAEGFTQVAHYQGMRGHSFGRGGSMKGHDMIVAPLCCSRPGIKGCHAQFDDNEITGTQFEEAIVRKIDRSELFLFWVAKTIIQAEKTGAIKLE